MTKGLLAVVAIALMIFGAFVCTQATIAIVERYFGQSELRDGILYSVAGITTFLAVRFWIWSKKDVSS